MLISCRCSRDGHFMTIQSHDTLGVTWCVHPDGVKMHGTQRRGIPNCDPDGINLTYCISSIEGPGIQ